MIDILNIQSTTISRDLRGKYLCVYGREKVGKTTFASQLPNVLLCAFEKGYNFISGIKAVPITKWTDFKAVVKQLEKSEAKAIYDSIAIDTIGEAYASCETYICAQNGVQSIGDIPYGRGKWRSLQNTI